MRRGDGSCCSCSVPEVWVQHSSVPLLLALCPCAHAGGQGTTESVPPPATSVEKSIFFQTACFLYFYNVLHRKLLRLICSGLLHRQHPDITCHLGNSRWYTGNQQQPARAEGPHACMFCLLFVSKCDLQNKNTQSLSKHFLAEICFGLKH